MALNFPESPESGDTYIGPNGVFYTYDGEKWNGVSEGSSLSSVTQSIIPNLDNTHDLGSPERQWRDIFVSEGSVYIGDVKLSSQDGQLVVQQVTNPGQETEAPVPDTPGSVTTDRLVNGENSFVLNSNGTVDLNGEPFTGGGDADTGDITFDATTISAANGVDIIIEAKDEDGVANTSIKLDPEYAAVKLSAKLLDSRQFYEGESQDYATGTWTTANGSATLSLDGATRFLDFTNDDAEWRQAGDRETGEFSLDGDVWYQWPYSSSSSGPGQISVTFSDPSFTANDPVGVETFYLRWTNESYITVDQDDYSEVKIVGAGVGINIKSTGSINSEAGDSINFEAQRSISLQTITDPVRIETSLYNNTKTWEFKTDGVLSLPQDGDIVDSNGNSVLGGGGSGGSSIANGDTSVSIPEEGGDVVIDLDDNNSVFRFTVDGTLQLPQGGSIAEDIVTDNPTIDLTPADPDVESQKLVIKGGASYGNEENGIAINTDSLTVAQGETITFYVYSPTYAGETFYWWVDLYSPGEQFDPDNGTVELDESGFGQFSFTVLDDTVPLKVYVADTLYNAYINGKGAASVTVNGPNPDMYHLHLTTGDLQETSVFLGTDNHNVRTKIDGSVELTSYDYDNEETYRLNFKNNVLKIASTYNEGDEDLYIKAEDDLYLDALDDDIHIRADDDIRLRPGYDFEDDYATWEVRFTNSGDFIFYNQYEGNTYGTIRQYNNSGEGPRSMELEGDQNAAISTNGGEHRWTFDGNGDLTFPDSTVQTTAWAGGRVVAVPGSSTGAEGDKAGDIAFSPGHIYYCFEDYDSGVSYNTTLSNITEDDNKFIFSKGEGIVEPSIGWSITVDVGGDNEETNTITLVEDLATDWRVTWSGINVTFDPGTAIRIFSTNIWRRVAWGNDTW